MQHKQNYGDFASNFLKIFIGGIPDKTSREEMFERFSSFGIIIDLVIIKDKKTNNSRGFGFVTYKVEEAFEMCLSKKHFFHGKEIELKRALPRDQNPKEIMKRSQESRKLFIGGLPKDLTLHDFKTHFERYGEIEDIVIIMDKLTQQPRGFGFVTYFSYTSLKMALSDFKNHFLRDKWVEVKMANSRFEEDKQDICKASPSKNNTTATNSIPKFNQEYCLYQNNKNAFENNMKGSSTLCQGSNSNSGFNTQQMNKGYGSQRFNHMQFFSPQEKSGTFDFENLPCTKPRMQKLQSMDEAQNYNNYDAQFPGNFNENHYRNCEGNSKGHFGLENPPGLQRYNNNMNAQGKQNINNFTNGNQSDGNTFCDFDWRKNQQDFTQNCMQENYPDQQMLKKFYANDIRSREQKAQNQKLQQNSFEHSNNHLANQGGYAKNGNRNYGNLPEESQRYANQHSLMAGRDMQCNSDYPMNYNKNKYANNCKKIAQNTEPWAQNYYNEASTLDSEMQISNILQNLTLDEISLLNQYNKKIVQEKLLRDHESLNIKHTLMNLHKGLQSEAIKKQQNLNQAKEGFYNPFGNIQNYGQAMDLSKNKRNVDDHGTDREK